MRIELSSRITFPYKFILFPVWCLIALGMIVFTVIETKNPKEELTAILFISFMISLALFWMRKLRQISYDEHFIYIKNFRREIRYELSRIKAVNGGSWLSFDPFFEIVIEEPDGGLLKIDFFPPIIEHLDYTFSGKFSGKVLLFFQKLKALAVKN